MEGCTVNTVSGGYEAVHPDYPGKVGKGKSPQEAIDHLSKIEGRKAEGKDDASDGADDGSGASE